jgi:ATP phosphoribosyltransferase regulatory subunit
MPMNPQNRWLLPEGIEEVLPPQTLRLETLRRALLDLYAGWGYELIMPPFIEHLDSLLTGASGDLDHQTFKFTDPLSGRLIGLRADMTPQAARIDAHRLARETPLRLCYLGTVLRARSDGLGASRAPLQIGAELFGHASVESDIEILMLMLETLDCTGIREAVHVDLGHVGIYRALARAADLDGAQEAALFDALQRKATSEIAELLDTFGLAVVPRARLAALADLNGGVEVLDMAAHALAGAPGAVFEALDTLKRTTSALAARIGRERIHVDLAELRGYHYHTGLVFAAFVSGHGQAAAQGGRYDGIGHAFGRARPATGFSADLRTLVALAAAPETALRGVFAPADTDPSLDTLIHSLRAAGERVVRALPGQAGGGRESGCDRQLVRRNGDWQVAALD